MANSEGGLPAGTVTFLFTDLEVSTRLWDQEPEAMRAALARHDAILRDAVAVHGGQVVKGRVTACMPCSRPPTVRSAPSMRR
jgi:class 3 adenylate cyclase